jgi:hypothetical protein
MFGIRNGLAPDVRLWRRGDFFQRLVPSNPAGQASSGRDQRAGYARRRCIRTTADVGSIPTVSIKDRRFSFLNGDWGVFLFARRLSESSVWGGCRATRFVPADPLGHRIVDLILELEGTIGQLETASISGGHS